MMFHSAHSSHFVTPAARAGIARGAWLAAALGCGLSGCSMPLPSMLDPAPTGSIDRGAAAPDKLFAPGDWRAARPALARAIGAPASSKPSRWSNPDTKLSGDFVAVGAPFQRGGESCRKFVATIAGAAGPRSMRGLGCRAENGDIALRDPSDWTAL
jgi:hypothetical protein